MRASHLTFLLFAALLVPVEAAADRVQLTSAPAGCSILTPSGSETASVVAFASTCDLTGGNPDANREIFTVGATGIITQLTDTSACTNANPATSAQGAAVAFDSDCAIGGGNTDASVEIFLWRTAGITQLTDATACASLEPSINGAGSVVSFDSDCDLDVGQNSDRNHEIFLWSESGGVVQLTDDGSSTGCASIAASSNVAGDLIAFESDCDLTGENADAIGEIFQVDASGTVTQLTASEIDTCLSTNPASDAGGGVVAFESDCDYAGENGDGSIEIFTVTAGSAVAQVTDAQSGSCESLAPSIAADGATVAFTSYCNLASGNSDGSFEIFRADVSETEQVTTTLNCANKSPQAFLNGAIVVWASDCDLTGDNADKGDELFVDRPCACGAPVTRLQNGDPLASDALTTLRAAVGVGVCALCDCDVNTDGKVTASDALSILKRAVGQDVELVCA